MNAKDTMKPAAKDSDISSDPIDMNAASSTSHGDQSKYQMFYDHPDLSRRYEQYAGDPATAAVTCWRVHVCV